MTTEKWLIDANALKETVTTDYYEHFTRYHDTDQIALIDMVCDDIEEAPTVDAVEVVHGRWKKGEADKHGNRKPACSVCGEYHLAWWSDYTHCNYCPNCGAKMDGGINK